MDGTPSAVSQHHHSRARGRLRGQRGQGLVEFAVGSLVFFMTIFGTLEFALAVFRYNMVANLAQEGARWASVHGKTSACPVSEADVGKFINGGTVCGTVWPARAVGFTPTVTTPAGAPSTKDRGAVVSVRVTTPFSPLTGLIPFATMTLQSNSGMVVSR